MKKYFLLLLIFLVACTPAEPLEKHTGCSLPEIEKDGTCVLASEENNNANLFDNLDSSLIQEDQISYYEGVKGFLAKPKELGNYPGVVMIHEWWGLNDNIRDMARLLAKEGYVVLAVDLYNGQVATESSDARKYMTEIKQEEANANMKAAVEYLRTEGSKSIGSMGWCFGGGQSLQLALSGEQMDATVIYYGRLTDDKDQLSAIKWPVLGIFAEKDQGIPPSTVNSFEKALNELGVKNSITIYPGVDHAFANPSGARYAPKETKDAWEKTVSFLNTELK